MTERLFVQLIADYGVGDPAFGEVVQKLTFLDPTIHVHATSVPKFSTIATGFWTSQYAFVNPLPGMVIFTNTAPRKDDPASRAENEGERLVLARLTNGISVVGVNAGYCFSFIKPHIKELYHVRVANKGSQFRSRDFYPEAVVSVAQGQTDHIGEPMDINSIPDVPTRRVAWIDGYGNMKTTVRASEMKMLSEGQTIVITIGDMRRTAFFTRGTFHVGEGELAFAPGSSGGDDRFMELFLRGLSAWKEFGKPNVETEFQIEPV